MACLIHVVVVSCLVTESGWIIASGVFKAHPSCTVLALQTECHRGSEISAGWELAEQEREEGGVRNWLNGSKYTADRKGSFHVIWACR